jgi:hypothetical protein
MVFCAQIGRKVRPTPRCAARIGDGWLTDLQPPAEIVECIEKFRQCRKEYGREPNDFDVLATPMDVFDIDGCKRLEEQGVTRIMSQPWMIYSPGAKDLQLEGCHPPLRGRCDFEVRMMVLGFLITAASKFLPVYATS